MEQTPAVNLDLTGRVAIVTGASRRQGIGAAISRALASHGAAVLFTHWQPYDQEHGVALDQDGPATLERELTAHGSRASGLSIDLAAPDAHLRLLDTAAQLLGQPTILVNNAAFSTRDGYRQLDGAILDQHYRINLRATALLSVEFARRWPGGPGGRIINLTSGQDLGAMPGELAYVATKGALSAFTRSLAAEVAALGITVNAVDPGVTDTGWMSAALEERLRSSHAAGRLGLPEDAARLIAFLASDAGAWINGQVLHSRGE